MIPGPETESCPKPKSRLIWRRLLGIILGLTILTLGVSVTWRLNQPALEPLPSVPMEHMEPEVRNLVDDAAAKVANNNRSAVAWGDLGAVLFVHYFEDPAQVCFRNAERLDPGDYRWPYLLGATLIYTDGDQALAAYRRAVERCGERPHVQLRLVEMLLERGDLEDAGAQIQKILVQAPSNSRAEFAKARLLLAQGKLEEARSWAERSAAAEPDKRAPHLLLAQLCRRTHDAAGEAKTVAALQKIPDGFTPWEDPDIKAILDLRQDHATRLAKAENLAKTGDSVAAKGILYEMTKGSDGSSATAKLARTLIGEGKNREAEALLRQQLRGDSNDERLHMLLGGTCFLQEKFPDAEAAYRRVIELKPDNVDAWYNLGLALLKLDKPGDAREAFATTVRISPSRVFARINLAELLLAEGKKEEAIEHLEAAIKLAPGEQEARELLARAKAPGK